MRALGNLPLAVLLTTASAFGQFHALPRTDPSQCPVSLEVQQNGTLVSFKKADFDQTDVAPLQTVSRFDFKVTNPLPRDVVSIRIKAHGFSSKWRLFTASDPLPDMSKTVEVTLNVKGNGSASREVSFGRFSSIGTFELDAVNYADGSAWHATSAGACKVAPSPVVLIGLSGLR